MSEENINILSEEKKKMEEIQDKSPDSVASIQKSESSASDTTDNQENESKDVQDDVVSDPSLQDNNVEEDIQQPENHPIDVANMDADLEFTKQINEAVQIPVDQSDQLSEILDVTQTSPACCQPTPRPSMITKDFGGSLEELLGIHTTQEEELYEPHCPQPIRTIKISKAALEMGYIMAQQMHEAVGRTLEVYCLLLGKDGVAMDIIIPKQEVTYTNIEVSSQSILELSQYIRRHPEYQVMGWLHSHCDFGVFFSSTDDANQEILMGETSNTMLVPLGDKNIKMKYVYGMTVNTRRNVYGVVTSQFPCGQITTEKDVDVEIVGELPSDWNDAFVREVITEELKRNVSERSYRTWGSNRWAPTWNEPKWNEPKGKAKKGLDEYISHTPNYKEKIDAKDIVDIGASVKTDDSIPESERVITVAVEEDLSADPNVMKSIDGFMKERSKINAEGLESLKKDLYAFAKFLNDNKKLFP